MRKMSVMLGSDSHEGQLCPYEDCQQWNDLTEDLGWHRCVHCGGKFWYRAVDGDYEDYHCFMPDFRISEQPE